MRPLPIRIRVTAAMALAMAVVLAATGWFLYARLESHLRRELDTSLQVRADDLAALVREGGSLTPSGRGLIEPGESFAQLLSRDGRVTLQFKAEAFNALNHFNPANPNTSLTLNFASGANTNANFGTITGAVGQARRMALSAKLRF